MKYRKLAKYKYQIVEDCKVTIDHVFSCAIITDWIILNGDRITVRKGYCWDGATCAIDTNDFMIASLVHDAMYQLIRVGKMGEHHREDADIILRELCLKAGMPMWRANYIFWAVRFFGGKHIQIGKPQDEIYEVK